MQKRIEQYFDANRLNLFYAVIVIIFLIFIVRLFYIQIIQHSYYRQQALDSQYREYEIPAERGMILAKDGSLTIPIVLNEEKFTIFADPKFISDPKSTAIAISKISGGSESDYEKAIAQPTRYVVLEKKVDEKTKQKIEDLHLKGIGYKTESVRTYPQGDLASQLLGFVNDEGKGNYGIEQALDDKLKGTPGELKAITDVNGVPLAATGDNVRIEPKNGQDVSLTIDIGMQRRLEKILKQHLKEVKSPSGSAIIMDPYTGAVKAMANYPTYSPADFYKVKDASLFTNPAVDEPLEVGSIMKTLTVAAGLDSGAIKANQTFYDPSKWEIDNSTISNVEEDGGAGRKSIEDILRLSLNTGAVYILMQMGGGHINEQARDKWHDYLVDHYYFGQKTGIEQGYEATGYVPDPNKGYGLDLQYANMAFGQGISVTPIQFAAAYCSTINGGIYYKPHLVEEKPIVVNAHVVSPEVSKQMRTFHITSTNTHFFSSIRKGYNIGGKTGTAEVPNPAGGYYKDKYNGTFVGFIGGNKPQYVILVKVNTPNIPGYAGTVGGLTLFNKVIDMLIDNFSISTAT